jgi:hypothetical protein
MSLHNPLKGCTIDLNAQTDLNIILNVQVTHLMIIPNQYYLTQFLNHDIFKKKLGLDSAFAQLIKGVLL